MVQLLTQITTVTVYPDRARIERAGDTAGSQVTLEKGSQLLEIRDLPLTLQPDSVRAAARGSAQVRLLGVQVVHDYYIETPAEQVRQLEAQVESLQDEIQAVLAQGELLKQSRGHLNNLLGHVQIYATALAAKEMTLADQTALFEGIRAQALALEEEMQALNGRKRELDRRLQKAKNELDQQRSSRPRERYTALVEVEVLEPGDLTVELVYVVSGASWKPLYDLRLLYDNLRPDGPSPVLEVAYLAQVIQRTGEPWQDVSLTLSTARPALSERIPELHPWYIQPYLPPPAPQPMRKARGPMMMAAGPLSDSARAASEEAPEMMSMPLHEAEVIQAGVDTSGASVTYHVPAKVSLATDGSPQKVTVARFNLPPKLDYVSAPKLVEAAYRRATVLNDSPYLLLPGAVSLFDRDEFIGSTDIDLTASQGEIELYLGVDDRVKVERELKRREVDKTLIGGKRRLHVGYEITLENLLPSAIHFELVDQLPVPRHEDIKVRMESVEPKPDEQTDLNLLTWKLNLAPKEKRTVRFYFNIEYPQSMEVVGLP